MEDTLQHYDEGWNARCEGKPYRKDAKRDWQDGWKDCEGAPQEDRKPI